MLEIEVVDLVKDHIGNESLGADGGGVVKLATVEFVWVVTEHFSLAGGGTDFGLNAKKYGDVLKGVQSIGDEKRHYDHVQRGGELVPVGDEGLFLHVGIQNRGVTSLAELLALIFDRLGAVRIEIGAVAYDDERGLAGVDVGSDFARTTQQKLGH